MDLAYLIELDKQLLLSVNGSSSLFLDGLAETLTTASTWIPLYTALLYLVAKSNDSLQKVLLVVACAGMCVFWGGSLNDMFVKTAVARWRPTHDVEIGGLVDVVNGYRGGSYGFFSSHASNTFSLAVFFSLLVRSRLLTFSLLAWSLLNCWTRMYLGVHFPGDILCGIVWGTLVGTVMWLIHRRVYRMLTTSVNYISTQYTSTGYQFSDVDAVVSVLAFTLIYAILKACFFLYI